MLGHCFEVVEPGGMRHVLPPAQPLRQLQPRPETLASPTYSWPCRRTGLKVALNIYIVFILQPYN